MMGWRPAARLCCRKRARLIGMGTGLLRCDGLLAEKITAIIRAIMVWRPAARLCCRKRARRISMGTGLRRYDGLVVEYWSWSRGNDGMAPGCAAVLPQMRVVNQHGYRPAPV